jgi:hypothetical protein
MTVAGRRDFGFPGKPPTISMFDDGTRGASVE